MTRVHKNRSVAPLPPAAASNNTASVAKPTLGPVDTVTRTTGKKRTKSANDTLSPTVRDTETLAERCKQVLSLKCDARGAPNPINVADILGAFSEELMKTSRHPSEAFVGGSVHAYLIAPDVQPTFPKDLDPIIYVDAEVSPEALHNAARQAMDNVIKRLGGAGSTHAAYFKEDAEGNRAIYLRIGDKQVLDVRVLPRNSPFKPYDFVCNAGLVSFKSIQAGKPVAQGAGNIRAGQVIADLRQGVARMDHALSGDSLYRVWKMAAKGRVLTQSPHENDLLPTLIAALEAEGRANAAQWELKEDPLGLALRMSTFVSRAMSALPPAKQAAMLANALVQLRRYDDAGSAPQATSQRLQGLVSAALRTMPSSARAAEAFTLMQLPSDTETLSLWLRMLASPTDALVENGEDTVQLQRTEVDGVAWFRIYLPESQSYLVLPDASQAALANLRSDVPSVTNTVYQPDPKALNELLQPSGGARQIDKLVPAGFFESAEQRKIAAERLRSLLAETPTDAVGARARVLLACCVLQPHIDYSRELLELAKVIEPPLANEYRQLAERQQRTSFQDKVETLISAKKQADRTRLLSDISNTFSGASADAHGVLNSLLTRRLGDILENLAVNDQGALATVLGAMSNVADPVTLKACYKQLAVLTSRKTTDPKLLDAIGRVISTDSGLLETTAVYAIKNGVVAELLASDKLTAAWNAMSESPESIVTLDGRVAATLLERINPKLLASNLQLSTALLECAADAKTLTRTFYESPKRYRMFLGDDVSLRHMGHAVDNDPLNGTEQFVMDWVNALKMHPMLIEDYLAENSPEQPSFMSATCAGVSAQQTRRDGLLFLERYWGHVLKANIDSSATLGTFVCSGLVAAFNTEFPDPLDSTAPVMRPTLKQWQAAIRQVPEDVRLDATYFLAAMFLSQDAYADTMQTLTEVMDVWNTKPADRLVGTALALMTFTKLAESVGPLSLDTLRVAERLLGKVLISAIPWVNVRPSITSDERLRDMTSIVAWQNTHAFLFLSLITEGDTQAAQRVLERIYTQFPDASIAELQIRDAHNNATPREREAWNAFGMQLLMNAKSGAPNSVRMGELLIGSDIQTLIQFTQQRAFLQPVAASDELARKLDVTLKGSSAAITTLKQHLETCNLGTMSDERRVALTPLIRAYVRAEGPEPLEQRLADAYRWIGVDPDAPLPENMSILGRLGVMTMLVGVGESLFAGGPKIASARYRNLLQELMKFHFTIAAIRELMQAAKKAIPNVAMLTHITILSQLRDVLKKAKVDEAALTSAMQMTIRAHLVCTQVLLHEDPKQAEALEAYIVGTMPDFVPQDRVAIAHMAASFIELSGSRSNAATVRAALAKVSAYTILNADEEATRGFMMLREEFTNTVCNMVFSREKDAFAAAVYDILFAGLYTGNMSTSNAQRLGQALTTALAEPVNRRALDVVLRGWNNINAKKSPLGAAENATRLFDARVPVAPLSGPEVLMWLGTATSHRETSADKRKWDDLMVRVVNSAVPGALARVTKTQLTELSTLVGTIKRGNGRSRIAASAAILAQIDRLAEKP